MLETNSSNYIIYKSIINSTGYILGSGMQLIQSFTKLFVSPTNEELVQKGLANLYAVRGEVAKRENTLRESVKKYLEKATKFTKLNMKREAKIMIKLHMLYDIQVNHCQTTLTAIESHIISLESMSLNKKVCNALKESNYVNGFETIDEDILETAVEKLDDRNISTNEFLKTIGESPSVDIDDGSIDNMLKQIEDSLIETAENDSTSKSSSITPTNPLFEFPTVPTCIPVVNESNTIDTVSSNSENKLLVKG